MLCRLTVRVRAPSRLDIPDVVPYVQRKLRPFGFRVFIVPHHNVYPSTEPGCWIVVLHGVVDKASVTALQNHPMVAGISPYIEEANSDDPSPPSLSDLAGEDGFLGAVGPPPTNDWPLAFRIQFVIAKALYPFIEAVYKVRSKLTRWFG